jgi:hypothetical protein
MDGLKAVEAAVERIVLNPQYHDILMLVKAVRNGIIYGCKVRFPHALVYAPSGPPKSFANLTIPMDKIA